MVKKISLLGLELDNYSFPESIKIIESFLADAALSTVLSVNTEKLLLAAENQTVREEISAADYTVITDKALLEAIPQSASERMFEVEEGSFLNHFLSHMYRADRTFYLAASDEAQLEELYCALTAAFSYIRIVGSSVIPDDPEEYERCVNEINILVPDVILSSMKSPDEEYFLSSCRAKLCARIWYGAGTELLIKKGRFSAAGWVRRMRNRIRFRSRLDDR